MTRGAPDPADRPVWNGTTGPSSGTPDRAAGSWRRSIVVDGCFVGDSTEMRGRGLDVRTGFDGSTSVERADAVVRVDTMTRVVQSVVTDDPFSTEATQALLGVPSFASYRKVVARALPDDVAGGSLRTQLLDEPPGILLVAAGSLSRRGIAAQSAPADARARLSDICAGWRSDGDMLRAIDEGDLVYSGEGPWAGDIERPDDALAWPSVGPLAVGSVRRHRRVDLIPRADGTVAIDVLFRDSYVEPGGRESAVHEYAVIGACDRDGVLLDLRAEPHVLPGPQCPHAAASATRLVGTSLRDVRDRVRSELNGTSTCTHLNDTLRAIGACWRGTELVERERH